MIRFVVIDKYQSVLSLPSMDLLKTLISSLGFNFSKNKKEICCSIIIDCVANCSKRAVLCIAKQSFFTIFYKDITTSGSSGIIKLFGEWVISREYLLTFSFQWFVSAGFKLIISKDWMMLMKNHVSSKVIFIALVL